MSQEKNRSAWLRVLASPVASLYLSLGALFAGVGIHAVSPISLSGALISPNPHLTTSFVPITTGEKIADIRESLSAEIQSWGLTTPMLLDPRTESFTMRRGDTLMDLLSRAGLDRVTSSSVIQAIHRVYNPKRMQPGQGMDVTYQAPALAIDGTPELAEEAGARVVTSALMGKGESMEEGWQHARLRRLPMTA